MTFILESHHRKNKAFSNQNNGHLGSRYIFASLQFCFAEVQYERSPKRNADYVGWIFFTYRF